jgi:hypothetical protein
MPSEPVFTRPAGVYVPRLACAKRDLRGFFGEFYSAGRGGTG